MLETRYAPAERHDLSLVEKHYSYFSGSSVLNSLLGKIDQYILVLNSSRQIVYSNNAFMSDFGFSDITSVLGVRVGEALNCRFAACMEAGCGTSDFCRECGAVKSMLEAQQKIDNIKECIILTNSGKTLELAVSSKAISVNEEDFIIFSVADVSEKKHTRLIEDIFYHDVTNLASSMYSMIQLMHDDRILDKEKIHNQLLRTSEELMSELHSHRLLKSAERKELTAKMENHNSLDLLKNAVGFVERLQSSRGNILYIHHNSADFELKTDMHLFNRVMVNMLTNAIEASGFGDKVSVGCEIANNRKIFWVHNKDFIEPHVQSKIFRVPFSTKKRGSGYGTTSMRIISETYLGGIVDFESFEKTGTTFRLILN